MARKSPWDTSMAHGHHKAHSGSSIASSEEQNVCPCNETGRSNRTAWRTQILGHEHCPYKALTCGWPFWRIQKCRCVWHGENFHCFFVSFLKESSYPCFTLFSTFSFAQGFVPFLVSATAGTTVYGAFDPLLAVADICKKYKIWMHVDVSIP